MKERSACSCFLLPLILQFYATVGFYFWLIAWVLGSQIVQCRTIEQVLSFHGSGMLWLFPFIQSSSACKFQILHWGLEEIWGEIQGNLYTSLSGERDGGNLGPASICLLKVGVKGCCVSSLQFVLTPCLHIASFKMDFIEK